MLLFVFFALSGRTTTTQVGDGRRASYPAAGVLQPGDRLVAVDGRGGTPEDALEADRDAQLPGEPPTKGCKATSRPR